MRSCWLLRYRPRVIPRPRWLGLADFLVAAADIALEVVVVRPDFSGHEAHGLMTASGRVQGIDVSDHGRRFGLRFGRGGGGVFVGGE